MENEHIFHPSYVNGSKTDCSLLNMRDIMSSAVSIGLGNITTMQKEAYLKKILGKDELPIGHYPQARYYAIKVPASIRRQLGIGIPERVTGKSREVVIDKLFDIFIGRNIEGTGKNVVTLTRLFQDFIKDREMDPDFAAHTVRKNISDWNTFYRDTPLAMAPISTIRPADLMDHFKLMTIPRPEDKESLIFIRDYKPIRTQTVNDHLRNVCRKLGIRYLSTHKIRAWGITEALASGMDQASVMRIAGHASPQTMSHYVRVARVKKDIDERFNSVFD